MLGHLGGNLTAEAADLHRLVHHQQPPGLGHRVEHHLAVPRPQGAQVDHFGRHRHAAQGGGGGFHHADHGRPGDDGQIVATAHDAADAERNRLVVGIVDLALHAPQPLVLHVDHRVVAADRRLEQAAVVGRRRRGDDD